jgi:hypothetical protein
MPEEVSPGSFEAKLHGENERNVHVTTLKRSFSHYSFENVKRYVDTIKLNETHSYFVLSVKKNVELRIEAASTFFSQKIWEIMK